MVRFILVAIVMLSFVGCASTQRKTEVDQVYTRVTDLEKKLEEKDAEIVDLQYEVKDLSSKLESSSTKQPKVVETAEPVVINKTSDGILKVDVSAERLQEALKNAGYYTGKVDGKIGSGTKAAVVAFQKAQGLRADGVVGRRTWDALKQYSK